VTKEVVAMEIAVKGVAKIGIVVTKIATNGSAITIVETTFFSHAYPMKKFIRKKQVFMKIY